VSNPHFHTKSSSAYRGSLQFCNCGSIQTEAKEFEFF